MGGNETVKVNVRVITATHQDLQELCRMKRFREDLYFRINVLPLRLPSLRERKDDISALADYILQRIAERRGAGLTALAPEARDMLLQYDWPGKRARVGERARTVQRLLRGQ